jgi:hypothetical protein
MEGLLKELKKRTIEHLKRSGKLDEPYIGKGRVIYTRSDIIDEINKESKEGLIFLSDLVVLSLDRFNRGKEKLNNYEKENTEH